MNMKIETVAGPCMFSFRLPVHDCAWQTYSLRCKALKQTLVWCRTVAAFMRSFVLLSACVASAVWQSPHRTPDPIDRLVGAVT